LDYRFGLIAIRVDPASKKGFTSSKSGYTLLHPVIGA